jgi:hypothetical protein
MTITPRHKAAATADLRRADMVVHRQPAAILVDLQAVIPAAQ